MRRCGDCQLCCKLLPVADVMLKKSAGERCRHQAHHVGCRVYNSDAMPPSCKAWSCAWLIADEAADLRRPDRAHYVIDILPDFVTMKPDDGGEPVKVPVVQVWLDPDYPDAHRDPGLRKFLAKLGETRGMAALIRSNSKDAFFLAPPALASDGKWHELTSNNSPEPQHSAAAIRDVMTGR